MKTDKQLRDHVKELISMHEMFIKALRETENANQNKVSYSSEARRLVTEAGIKITLYRDFIQHLKGIITVANKPEHEPATN